MANLSPVDKKYLTSILESEPGYVLDFTNPTYSEFFKNTVAINIYADKYTTYGSSKMKRLKAFWELEQDLIVGKVLKEMLALWEYQKTSQNEDYNTKEYEEYSKIILRLLKQSTSDTPSKKDFLHFEFKKLILSKLNIDPQFEKVIQLRLDEIKKSLASEAPLAVIFLCGSTLEGLLLDIASKNKEQFDVATAAPKERKSQKVKELHHWSLANLIDASHELGFIELDIKKYSHSLRDFRNYIHPRQQAVQNFNPDKHTAEISWKVLQATIASLSGERT